MKNQEWQEIYAGPYGCKRCQTQIGWLEIDLWLPQNTDAYFYCREVGYKQYSTHTKDVDEAKETALIHVLARLKSLFELAGKLDFSVLSDVPSLSTSTLPTTA